MLKYRNFTILLEKRDLTNKIKKFANIPEIYEWANNIDSNQALFLTNIIVNKLKSTFSKDEKLLNKLLKTGTSKNENFDKKIKKYIKNYQRIINNDVTKILHYVNSPVHNNKPNINKLSFKDALKLSDDWHKDLEKYLSKSIVNETGNILKVYDDGFYWIDLENTDCKDEAESMGHCGITNKGTTILSLRDFNKVPHVTIAYNEDDNIFTQIKGRGNTKPIKRYHPYIVDLIILLNVKGFETEYNRKEDFSPDDLDDDLYKELEEKNPTYIENSKEMSEEELIEKYKQYLNNNWIDEIEINPYCFWENIDDKNVIKTLMQNDIDQSSIEDIFDDNLIVKYIINNVDENDVKKYLKNEHNYNDDDFNEYDNFRDFLEIKIDTEKLQEIAYEFDLGEDILEEYYKEKYEDYYNVKDLYDSMFGNSIEIDINNYFIQQIIYSDNFDKENFIECCVNNIEYNDDYDYLRNMFD